MRHKNCDTPKGMAVDGALQQQQQEVAQGLSDHGGALERVAAAYWGSQRHCKARDGAVNTHLEGRQCRDGRAKAPVGQLEVWEPLGVEVVKHSGRAVGVEQ
jgi:hypothetical protein